MTTTTDVRSPRKPKADKAAKAPRARPDDGPSSLPLAPWLPGYRPLDPPKLGSDDPLPERPEGPPPSGSAVAEHDADGPDLPSPMVVLAVVPLGALLLTGAFTAVTRGRRIRVWLSRWRS